MIPATLIPGLPQGMRVVPAIAHQDDDLGRQDWFSWRDKLVEERAQPWRTQIGRDRGAVAQELAVCASDPAYWLAMYGWVFEPRTRKREDGTKEPAWKPFTPFGFQAHLLRWLDERMDDDDLAPDGYVSKARGLGATWVACGYALHGWLFRAPFDAHLVSRKEDLVDKPNDKGAMFWKIDRMLERLPPWMIPTGFDPVAMKGGHRYKMNLTNPVNGNTITGESTTSKTGRGQRATFVLYDEAAFMADFDAVHGTGSGTTDHRLAVSSESFEEGDAWWKAWHAAMDAAPAAVLELDWWLNPYFNNAWYDREEERFRSMGNAAGFANEYLRDPFQGTTTWIYPSMKQRTADAEGWDPDEQLMVGIDPGYADPTALVFANVQGMNAKTDPLRWFDAYENDHQPAEYYAHILTGLDPQPGDIAYGCRFGANEERVMSMMRRVPGYRVTFCMDPAGGNKDSSGESFHSRLIKQMAKLRRREADALAVEGEEAPSPKQTRVLYEMHKDRGHPKRQNAMNELLNRSQFSNTQGGKRCLYVLQQARNQDRTRQATTEAKPIHDELSHVRTAIEFVAVWSSFGAGRKQDDPQQTGNDRRKRLSYAKRTHRELRRAA